MITGIAWDHINVFPTFDFYLEQFTIFIEKIEKVGLLIYNASDKILKDLVRDCKRNDIRYIGYVLPQYSIENGITNVIMGGERINLKIFGIHNLLNLQAAYYVCKELGINNHDFAVSIAGFTGAANRLELLAIHEDCNVYRDFAHAPSKVKASVDAVKLQYPGRKLVAVLELHTFSSLNAQFMHEYSGAMENADTPIVFFSKHALELKRMPPLEIQVVKEGFNKPGLEVITTRKQLEEKLKNLKMQHTNFLFMSSGNYEGMDISKVLGISG